MRGVHWSGSSSGLASSSTRHWPARLVRAARIGSRQPRHVDGVGLALLAHQPDPFVDAYLARTCEDPPVAAVPDPGRLRQSLAEIRARGGYMVALLLDATNALHEALCRPGMPTASDLRWMATRAR
ncbi:hypothetical protein Ae406Ps2_0530c [Pseudonocardia sp. Ae406_Ps2]|nr:hypothetical protein Ae406Ps2_0530c [Pseudonocardia sp. Ae406_Ps2]OLM07679.1 hypothetical protein Ae331Ps2_5389 [Pseudonocardia sp. Ae331_Ps2]OLM22102.1 hypothetical protein Ae706Ps2_0534c [Pseudonocardia sp. Ae706_Ps2]